MKKNLSIIIAHYNPNKDDFINPIFETLDIIENQLEDSNIEVIIADDGSYYSQNIINNYSKKELISGDDRCFYTWEDEQLNFWINKNKFNSTIISRWAYLPKSNPPAMSKARILNYAVSLSNSDNLLFLDDDNYFISTNTIKNVNQLLNQYNLIIGQIKDNNGRLRRYSSNRVQGTTIVINKKILIESGGFGEWTEKFSCGVDSDLWIKLYNYFNKNSHLKACYTDKISTFDSQSKRWKKYTKFFKEWNLKRKFNKMYDCKNYKNVKSNLSRNKKLWIDNLIDSEL
ncbi:MAG: hypothetical protein CMG64_05540 [Candidatus Marinimicrobia bacterium]|nr:hypothetical protein [Candidatus Neomarinimicrobiota bacterium]|tara:strand:- start:20209 stop:21066 length:858 start_codon:yes stop_codon:yes gene_type:complete